jgi:8-oxo-dGTP diphosphatase
MKRLVAASVLINRDDEYLFIKQNKVDGAYPGTLHLPGGRLEEDEIPDRAAAREVLEEVNVEVVDLKVADFDWDQISYKGEETQFIFLRFTARLERGEPVAGTDASEVIWVHKTDLAKQNHNPATLRLLKNLHLI